MDTTFDILKAPSILEKFDAILLDAYGVFWRGNGAGLIPGSDHLMEQLVSSRKIVGVLSNSTQLAAKEVEKLGHHGLVQGKHFHFFLTSGEISRAIFLKETLPFPSHKKKFWLFGGEHPKFSPHQDIFKNTPYQETSNIEEADFIYLSIPHIRGKDQVNPEVFRKELEKAEQSGLPIVCANPDLFAHEGNPPIMVVRQGSLARMYEEMGGPVFYIGKPSPKAYSMAFEEFQKLGSFTPNDILMVGDTPETDIRGATRFGMRSALILKTGIMAERIAEQGLERALMNLDKSDLPTYYMERFSHDI